VHSQLVVPGEKLCKKHLESDMELRTTSSAVDAIDCMFSTTTAANLILFWQHKMS
jgi:hypothetical protein